MTSILSTPLPKLAISFSLQSGCLSSSSVISSVTVGTSTSAVRTASAICSGVIGVSSRLSRASNSSRMRVSIESGSLRVTTTRGFFLTDMSCSHEVRSDLINPVVRHCRCSAVPAFPWGFPEISLGFPKESFGLVSFSCRSVLSSRRPGQDKNNPERRRRGPCGHRAEGRHLRVLPVAWTRWLNSRISG